MVNTIWLKATGLSAVQHAAAVMLTGFSGDQISLWHIAWHDILGLAGGTAVASILAAIVAYKAPTPGQAAVLSVPTGASQAAVMALETPLVDLKPLAVHVSDETGARGT